MKFLFIAIIQQLPSDIKKNTRKNEFAANIIIQRPWLLQMSLLSKKTLCQTLKKFVLKDLHEKGNKLNRN